MKKIKARQVTGVILLGLIIVFSLTACNTKEKELPNESLAIKKSELPEDDVSEGKNEELVDTVEQKEEDTVRYAVFDNINNFKRKENEKTSRFAVVVKGKPTDKDLFDISNEIYEKEYEDFKEIQKQEGEIEKDDKYLSELMSVDIYFYNSEENQAKSNDFAKYRRELGRQSSLAVSYDYDKFKDIETNELISIESLEPTLTASCIEEDNFCSRYYLFEQ